MKNLLIALALVFATLLPQTGFGAVCAANGRFEQVIYLYGTATGGTGLSPSSPLPFVDGDLWVIPAYTVIDKVYVVVDTAITGTTNFDVGDDDDADGYIDGSLSVTLGTPGMYGWDAKLAGAYLRVQTAGATDAADIYVVPNAKYYSAAGKEIKLDVTGTNTAGRAHVVIQGRCERNPS